MGFYKYFRIAEDFCSRKLRPFAPAIYYEVARQLERYEYLFSEYDYIPWEYITPIYSTAYNRIVERIGEQVGKENHIRKAEKYVSYRD